MPMDPSLSEELAEKSTPTRSTETETGAQTEQGNQKLPSKVEHRAERIRSSVARLTASSINELEGLSSELNSLQEFLRSETERVEREVESALAGLRIIIETISPWKGIPGAATASRRDGINGLKNIKRLSDGTN
jgi:hypothetical protein